MPKGKGKGIACEKCGGPTCTLHTLPREDRKIIVREHMCQKCKHIFFTIQNTATKEMIAVLVE